VETIDFFFFLKKIKLVFGSLLRSRQYLNSFHLRPRFSSVGARFQTALETLLPLCNEKN
jgi:hypothetical protein